MKKIITGIFAFAGFLTLFAQDESGCKDHQLFNRMPHTTITECSSKFDQMEIYTGAEEPIVKEGMKTVLFYEYNDGTESFANAPSFLQIVKNYENALAKLGGKRIYFSADDRATLYVKTQGKEIWIEFVVCNAIGKDAGSYKLSILEIEEMEQDIKASAILEELNKSGHIALYINFETGKSVIKVESQKIIDEVISMLKTNADLKVRIEGHTDDVGQAAVNQKLSDDRAASVMNAVVKGGVDKTRLSAKGWGQTKPIADNKTVDGKALNRRVEIVKE
jgi:OmpA-OmpF porin, OOP family